MDIEKIEMDLETFNKMHQEDRMATEKLAEGIKGFSDALVNLEQLLKKQLETVSA